MPAQIAYGGDRSLGCCGTAAGADLPESTSPEVQGIAALLEDAEGFEKYRVALGGALLKSMQVEGVTPSQRQAAIVQLGKLRYEPGIEYTISQIATERVSRFAISGNGSNRRVVPPAYIADGSPFKYPACQALVDHGPVAIPQLVKGYVARKKELATKPPGGTDVRLRNTAYVLAHASNAEHALDHLKVLLNKARFTEVLGIEVEAMVELRDRISDEMKRCR